MPYRNSTGPVFRALKLWYCSQVWRFEHQDKENAHDVDSEADYFVSLVHVGLKLKAVVIFRPVFRLHHTI